MRQSTVGIVLAVLAAGLPWATTGRPAARATPPEDRSAQTGVTRIHAARLVDGTGALLEDVTVEIQGAKILGITRGASGDAIDLGDATLLPGLIDVHTHIDWHFGPDGRYPARSETPEQRTAAVAENLRATLMAGVTTVQNVGSAGDRVFREATASGTLVGPRILTSLGSVNGGTPEELRARVRRFKDDGADLVKIFASESVRTGGAPTMTQAQLDAACGEAKAVGLRTLVHAHAAEAVMRAARAGCTQVEHGAFASEEALALMRSRGTFFDPNIGLVTQNYLENRARFLSATGSYTEEGFAAMEKAIPDKIKAFRMAVASGVRMPMGTDAVAGAHGQNAREIMARVREGGQTPMEAILGATSVAAASLALDRSIGRIAAGFDADIIAVRGNPLADIARMRDVVFVMKSGRTYKP